MILKRFLIPFLLLTVFLAACTNTEDEAEQPSTPDNETEEPAQENPETEEEDVPFEIVEAADIEIAQLQGIGYPGNDDALYVATDQGLLMFKGDNWYETTSKKHDYFGFNAVEDGFISSGQQGEAKLGIAKSTDKGETLEYIAFKEKGQFPFLTAGYQTGIIYGINGDASTEMDPGLFRSAGEDAEFEPVPLNGFGADTLGMIAAHPTDANKMAMATRSGIYLSEDKGNNMELITEEIMVTALAFTEGHLYYSSVENEKVLFHSISLETMESASIEIPFLAYDNPITYITGSQKNEGTLAFSTYMRDLYQSADFGESWENILEKGSISN
ncbi:F510_1955 family glycosylhydrolase [Cytobacillus gottheilii]|uniref:Uncharacterized protein n=1 Tax=Cytobacillus gottheilii TaxID=859144 RepID=A0ABX8F7K3_9BACI|nr:hypothetical protein [Cytobacillus gottheilii]QVY60426.1 hypothetical protein J1899_15585 [Cytobacillus gottheilii]